MAENKLTDKEIIKAKEILDFFDFFNQRAGRELWSEKPFDIQNEDIAIFSYKVRFLKDLINRQQEEIEELKHEREVLIEDIHHSADQINEQIEEIEKQKRKTDVVIENYQNLCDRYVEARAEAIKEFADKLADVFYSHDKGDTYVREVVNNLVKEMVGEDK